MPWKQIDKKDIVFDPEVQTYCKNPKFTCPNYGHKWTCPPEAPYLENEIQKFTDFFLIYIKRDLPMKDNNEPFDFTSLSTKEKRKELQRYEKMRDEVEEEINKFLNLKKHLLKKVKILWDGDCRVCTKKGESCTFDKGTPCPYPDNRTYSMQAVGINVTKTVQNTNLDIQWPPREYVFRFTLIYSV